MVRRAGVWHGCDARARPGFATRRAGCGRRNAPGGGSVLWTPAAVRRPSREWAGRWVLGRWKRRGSRGAAGSGRRGAVARCLHRRRAGRSGIHRARRGRRLPALAMLVAVGVPVHLLRCGRSANWAGCGFLASLAGSSGFAHAYPHCMRICRTRRRSHCALYRSVRTWLPTDYDGVAGRYGLAWPVKGRNGGGRWRTGSGRG